MKFFHVYNEKYNEGLEKNGLLNEDSGIKIQHGFRFSDDQKFNQIAAKGSKLHSLIKEGNIPAYVDRIAGGTTYYKYPFDQDLIREYQEILGEWFLGVQLHESASGRILDWKRVFDRMDGQLGPYDAAELAKRSPRPHAKMLDGTSLYAFAHGYPDEYAARRFPQTLAELYEEIRWMYQTRMDEVAGAILPVDSHLLCTKMHNDLGMKTFMPEVGGQISQMRMQVALARGVAKTNNKKWGLYYECWRRVPDVGYVMPSYNLDPGNDWNHTQETHKDDFTTYGANGGSSRLLQNRIFHYALMAGAHAMAEEWGMKCSYNDMTTFELSEYGLCKKKFIDFARDHRKVKARVPFAFVIPCEFPCISVIAKEGREIGALRATFRDRPWESDEQKKRYGRIDDLVITFLTRSNDVIVGNEGHTMQNSRYGDLFDFVYDDASDEALSQYDYLIDGTVGGTFAAKKGDKFKVLLSDDLGKLEAEVKALIPQILPCTVDNLMWLISEDENGRYVSIFNNEGNERDHLRGDIIHHESDARAVITLKEPGEIRCIKAGSDEVKIEKINDTTYAVEVPAAQFGIFQF